ncbi:MAG: undecaprenyldiphospho-muramoylpentapeptide beta-N-acetylglucosaminyltransferase [Spongiibacteraceae bacterium]
MTDSSSRTVLIMAGGTGGHVFPALAAAECLRAQGINVEWLGTRQGIESHLVPAANIPLHMIKVSGLRGKNVVTIVSSLFQLFGAVYASIKLIATLKPVCILGMGGFVSGPGGLAAWLSRRPLVIHEQNAVAGTTNRLLAKLADKILLGYPIELGNRKSRYIGNPVRAAIAQLASPEQRLGHRSGALHLLVLGGSLGSKPINDVVPYGVCAMSAEQRPEIWHQTGKAHDEIVNETYQQLGLKARVDAFIDDMAAAYEWADVVLCRAGALTVAELTAAGVASVLVPLPHAIDDHQTENARWLVENNAGLMLPQQLLTPAALSAQLSELASDRQYLLTMSIAARALAKVDAAEQVAATCMEVACGES